MKRNFEYPKFSVMDDLGNPLSGGKIYFYEAGTSTLKDTYTDADGTVKNTNPVILDSRGEADIFLDRDPYKIVVKTADDVTVITRDNYQAYLVADDMIEENLLINTSGLINDNGYISGTTVVAGDDIFDSWVCEADGSVTFTPEGTVTLSAGCKIKHTNDDLVDLNGEQVTVSVESGEITVDGLGIPSPVIVSAGNPYTFTLDTATYPYIIIGGTVAQAYSGLAVQRGSAAVNVIRRPHQLERLLSFPYIDKINSNKDGIDETNVLLDTVLQGSGVVSRANFNVPANDTVTIRTGAYRVTTTNTDKVVQVAVTSDVTITIDYDIAGSPSAPWGDVAFLYILGTAADAKTILDSSTDFRLCPEWTPTYSEERKGWYYNDNRCIGVFRLIPSGTYTSYLMEGSVEDGVYTMGVVTSSSDWGTINLTPAAGSTVTGSLARFTGQETAILEVEYSVDVGGTLEAYIGTNSSYASAGALAQWINGFASGTNMNTFKDRISVPVYRTNGLFCKAISYTTANQLIARLRGYRWNNHI